MDYTFQALMDTASEAEARSAGLSLLSGDSTSALVTTHSVPEREWESLARTLLDEHTPDDDHGIVLVPVGKEEVTTRTVEVSLTSGESARWFEAAAHLDVSPFDILAVDLPRELVSAECVAQVRYFVLDGDVRIPAHENGYESPEQEADAARERGVRDVGIIAITRASDGAPLYTSTSDGDMYHVTYVESRHLGEKPVAWGVMGRAARQCGAGTRSMRGTCR